MQIQLFHIAFYLIYFFWIIGTALLFITKKAKVKNTGVLLIGLGTIILSVYIGYLWSYLGRPPFKTLGETRLWYSLFLSIIGIATYIRWKNNWGIWILLYVVLLSMMFLLIDLLKPQVFDQTLMPALQSVWFIPHVIVYMVAYAFLGVASLISVLGIIKYYQKQDVELIITKADNIVYTGFAFLTFGLLFGALWAKEAWGNYWTWDPKETWAFITWLCYLFYIHFRFQYPKAKRSPLFMLILSFLVILICWFGVNYLPSAASSVHVYGR